MTALTNDDWSRKSRELSELLELSSKGDRNALNELLLRIYPIIRLFVRRVRHREQSDEDDLVQNSVIRIWLKLPQCQATTDSQFLHWCRVITWRISADHFRSLRSEVTAGAASEPTYWKSEGEGEGEVDQEGEGEAEQVIKALAGAWTDLSVEAQDLLWWRVVEGGSWPEVAAELGITVSAAKRRYQRVQKRLRKALARGLRPQRIRS